MKKPMLLQSGLAAAVCILLSGYASATVTSNSEHQGFLPKPTQVLVHNFAMSPAEVKLDSRLGADLEEFDATAIRSLEIEEA